MPYIMPKPDPIDGDYPRDGSMFVVDGCTYRWKRYKPQGAKQMGKPGRFQESVPSGEHWVRWVNGTPPAGKPYRPYVEISEAEWDAHHTSADHP